MRRHRRTISTHLSILCEALQWPPAKSISSEQDIRILASPPVWALWILMLASPHAFAGSLSASHASAGAVSATSWSVGRVFGGLSAASASSSAKRHLSFISASCFFTRLNMK